MNKRGQTVVELMLLLSISILALSIIYSLYASQIDLSNSSKESSIAKSTINKLVNSANSLSLSGFGSTQKILIQVPSGVNVNDSNISGKVIYFKLSNGGEVFGYSDVNIVGEFKKINGVFVNEQYYVTLTFDGQKVILSYDDFELNTNGIFVSAKQGTIVQKFFTIRNNSAQDATFWVSSDFSYSNSAVLTIDSENTQFTLSPNESKIINFNIELSGFSSGNYAGLINVVGQINDGVSDSNITKQVVVSIESFLNLEPVMIFPKSISFDGERGESIIKSFSLCNSTPSDVSFSWERNTNPDANMLEWFNWPIVDSDGVAINSVSSGDCAYFDLNFTVPLNTFGTIYDANITINYNDTNSSSAYFFIDVEHIPGPYSLFFSTANNTLPSNYFLSNYSKQRTDTNYFAPTGELDWNASASYTYNSNDYNRDMNGLVAYYKLNDKNSSGWVLNSATGIRDGQLVATADVSASGFWDTNAGYFDGTGDYITAGSNPILGASPFTLSAWINTTKVNNYQGAISIGASNTANSAYIGTVGAAQTGTSNSIGGGFWSSNYGSGITTVNKWVHVALTYNGNVAKIYVDGNEKVSINYAIANLTNYNIRLGRIGSSTSYDYNGLIEEAKVFNRALSASEIVADYNRFLNAKYVDGNIVDAIVSSDWNSIKLNQDINYNFGKEISFGEKFFDVNLVGLWHFNDKNSDDWILNSATGIIDADLNNGAHINVSGLWDTNSLYLDGVNDHVAMPSASNLYVGAPGKFTVSAWVNPTSISSTRAIFVYGKSAVCFNYGMILSSGKLALRNSSSDYPIGSSVVEINKWSHLVVTSNGSTGLGYINGQYIGTVTYSSSACGISQATIGVRATNSISEPFVGKIDEVAIWNRNLSQSEIVDLYRKGVSRLDLDVYSCSDSSCNTKLGSQYIIDVNNGVGVDLNSNIINSRYLGFDAYFKKARGFEDYNASTFYVTSFVNDFNVIFIK